MDGEPRHRAVEHGRVHEPPPACSLPLQQGGQDPDGRGHPPAAQIAHLDRRNHGRTVGQAARPQQPGVPHVVDVVAHPVAVGPVLPVPGDRAVHEGGVGAAERVDARAQAVHDPWTEGLHQHVGAGGQPLQQVRARRVLQVQRQRALASVEGQVGGGGPLGQGRGPPDVVSPARLLHLDDLGPQIGQEQRAVPPRQEPGQVEDGGPV